MLQSVPEKESTVGASEHAPMASTTAPPPLLSDTVPDALREALEDAGEWRLESLAAMEDHDDNWLLAMVRVLLTDRSDEEYLEMVAALKVQIARAVEMVAEDAAEDAEQEVSDKDRAAPIE